MSRALDIKHKQSHKEVGKVNSLSSASTLYLCVAGTVAQAPYTV